VLFLDEPTTGLDPEARAELWQEIGRLTCAEGLTILLTTHYLEEADRLASRLAIVDRGRVVATGTPEELKAELRGDAILVELQHSEAHERAIASMQRVSGIHEPTLDGRAVRARADHGASTVPAVLSALEMAGIGVASVTVARPSLDDVYLRHTGRAFRHTEEASA
jgi:ABC-2 type transport system ATP-binding protein